MVERVGEEAQEVGGSQSVLFFGGCFGYLLIFLKAKQNSTNTVSRGVINVKMGLWLDVTLADQ